MLPNTVPSYNIVTFDRVFPLGEDRKVNIRTSIKNMGKIIHVAFAIPFTYVVKKAKT